MKLMDNAATRGSISESSLCKLKAMIKKWIFFNKNGNLKYLTLFYINNDDFSL
jgi:hypothetical protein